jgi:hypothetical protein
MFPSGFNPENSWRGYLIGIQGTIQGDVSDEVLKM